MPPLIEPPRPEAVQNNFIQTINEGPDFLDPALFEGPEDRVLLGLKAHANTINHSRLIALEQTFPLVRLQLGVARFNALSQYYIETPGARACDNNDIGWGFPDFLSAQDVETTATDLAKIELAWLRSYHAADADPLALSDLGDLETAELLTFRAAAHPAAHLVSLSGSLSDLLDGLAALHPHAILAVRPAADVKLLPLDSVQAAIFRAAGQKNATLGNLMAVSIEMAGETEPLTPVMYMINAGALIKAGT